jgi:hypothetical protein
MSFAQKVIALYGDSGDEINNIQYLHSLELRVYQHVREQPFE